MGKKKELMKVCTVSKHGNWQELCPNTRLFNGCVEELKRALETHKSKIEIRKIIEEWNKQCEQINCPYLKEMELKRFSNREE